MRGEEHKSRPESKSSQQILSICIFLRHTGNEIVDVLPLSERKWTPFSLTLSGSMQILQAVTKPAYYRALLLARESLIYWSDSLVAGSVL